MIETKSHRRPERALLIGLEKEGVSKWDLRDSLEELRELASSAGAQVVNTVTQKLPRPTAPFYIGKGKAELIKESKLRSSAAPVPDGCAVAADASEAKARATTLTAERLIIF